MKKLVMMAAVAAMSCGVFASQYNWGLNSFDYTGPNGEIGDPDWGFNAYDGGYAMLFLGTVTASDIAFDTSAATMITSGGFDADNFVYGVQDVSAGLASTAITSTDAGQAYSIVLLDKIVESLDGYEGNYLIIDGTSGEAMTDPGSGQYVAQFVSDAIIGGQDYSLILVDGAHSSLDELADGSYFAIRTGTSGSIYDGDLGDFTAELIDYNPIAAGDWQKFSGVPEPTSGLLLLLGMAGLALKRKNA